VDDVVKVDRLGAQRWGGVGSETKVEWQMGEWALTDEVEKLV